MEHTVKGDWFGPRLSNFQLSYIVFGKNLLDGPPEIGVRFLKAYFRGSEDFLHG